MNESNSKIRNSIEIWYNEGLYFHCTTSENIGKIKKDGFIGIKYWEGQEGFHIAKSPYECQYFGDKMIEIPEDLLDANLMEESDSHDGIFYHGYVPIELCEIEDMKDYLRLHKMGKMDLLNEIL